MLQSYVKKIINQNLKEGSIALSDYDIQYQMLFSEESRIGIVLLPPDPNIGGSMHEPIIEAIFRKAYENKISAIRITFHSYPIINNLYDKYIAQAGIAFEELKNEFEKPIVDFWMVGFSFGSLIALNLFLRRPECKGFIMISPPVLSYDFVSWLTPCLGVGMVVHGTNDPLLLVKTSNAYVQCLRGKKMTIDSVAIHGAEHSMQGKENEVAERVLKFILNNQSPQEQILPHLLIEDDEDDMHSLKKRNKLEFDEDEF